MSIEKDIESEEKDSEHYEEESEKRPKFKKTYRKMSKDEKGHEAKLKAIKKRTK